MSNNATYVFTNGDKFRFHAITRPNKNGKTLAGEK